MTTTSTTATEDEATSTPPVSIAGDPPQVELKEPGYYKLITTEEMAAHFVFSIDVSPSHTTTYTSTGPADTWSMTARSDGEFVHYLGTGSLAGEMLMSGSEVWIRDDSGEWVIDDEVFELPFFVAFPSPDFAYASAYQVFDDLEFVGWIQVAGDDLAVYVGGADASAELMEWLGRAPRNGHDGSVEVWWHPDGYFAKVEVKTATATGDFGIAWTVTDVGTTDIEPPA